MLEMAMDPEVEFKNVQREPCIHEKHSGYLMVFTDSTCRYMTWWEEFKYRWFGLKPDAYKKDLELYARWMYWHKCLKTPSYLKEPPIPPQPPLKPDIQWQGCFGEKVDPPKGYNPPPGYIGHRRETP